MGAAAHMSLHLKNYNVKERKTQTPRLPPFYRGDRASAMLRKRANQRGQRRDKSVSRGDLDSGQHPFCIFVTTSRTMAENRLFLLIARYCDSFESATRHRLHCESARSDGHLSQFHDS
jgi:hypothetical protein